jgi:hypothetical protein
MNSMQLGEAFDKIAVTMPGRLIPGASVIDVEFGHAYTWGELTEVFDMESSVYLRDNWLEHGRNTGVFTLLRLSSHPIVVNVPDLPALNLNNQVNLDHGRDHIMDKDGHSFDVLDMTWECECGNVNDPDQEHCGECVRSNPFLGVLL